MIYDMKMTKQSLAKHIITSFKDSEWDLLEKKPGQIPVSKFNRRILLNLREQDADFTGNVEEEHVIKFSNALKQYLAEVWSEQPEAHKYVISSCLALAFLYEIPMHPQEIVKYITSEKDGKKMYHCPAKQDSIICNFCVAEKAVGI